jgi:hypothetical protein
MGGLELLSFLLAFNALIIVPVNYLIISFSGELISFKQTLRGAQEKFFFVFRLSVPW